MPLKQRLHRDVIVESTFITWNRIQCTFKGLKNIRMIVLNMSLGVRNCTGYQKVPIAICVQISLRNGMTLGSRTCLRSNANQVPLLGKNFFTSHAPGRKMGLNIFSATNLQCQLFNVHPSYLLYLFICYVKKEPPKWAIFTFNRLSPLS